MSSVGRAIGVVFAVVGLVIALIAAGVVWMVTRPTPEDAVKTYLSAVKDGDFKTAIGFVPEQQRDGDLLTAQMLRSGSRSAISTGKVFDARPAGEDGVWTVAVQIFGVPSAMTQEFTVREPAEGSDQWTIDNATFTVSAPKLEEYGFTLNGEPVHGKQRVFPGNYEPAVDSKVLTVPSVGPVKVLDQTSADKVSDLKVTLTSGAADTIESLYKAKLAPCLAMTSYTTPCGANLSPEFIRRQVVNDGSVKRADGFDPDAAMGKNLQVVKNSHGRKIMVTPQSLSVRYTSTEFGLPGFAQVDTWPAVVDFSGAKPKFSWQRG